MSFDQDETTRSVTITTSSKNNTGEVLLQGLIEAPTSAGIDAYTWELTLEGATPERKTIELVVVEFEEPHQHRGSAAWRGSAKELPSCPGSTCTFTLTLERSGDDLDAIEVNLIASMSVTGEGDPPGGSHFEVKSE